MCGTSLLGASSHPASVRLILADVCSHCSSSALIHHTLCTQVTIIATREHTATGTRIVSHTKVRVRHELLDEVDDVRDTFCRAPGFAQHVLAHTPIHLTNVGMIQLPYLEHQLQGSKCDNNRGTLDRQHRTHHRVLEGVRLRELNGNIEACACIRARPHSAANTVVLLPTKQLRETKSLFSNICAHTPVRSPQPSTRNSYLLLLVSFQAQWLCWEQGSSGRSPTPTVESCAQ